MKKAQTGMMITLGIGVIVTVIILGVVFEFIRDNSLTVNNVINETITITSSKGTTANDNLNDISFFGNTTRFIGLEGVALNVDVNWTTTGNILVNPINFSDDNYNISYSYLPDSYLESGTSRTLVSIIPVLLAILILLFVFGFVAVKKGQ